MRCSNGQVQTADALRYLETQTATPFDLVRMAERMALRTDMLCLYSDEGTHDGRGPSMPIFKPDFNLDLMRSLPYVGRQLAFKCEALSSIGGFDEQYAELAFHDVLWRPVETHGLHVVEIGRAHV